MNMMKKNTYMSLDLKYFRFLAFLFLNLVFTSGYLAAQSEEADDIPEPPFVVNAPASSEWTIIFTPKKQDVAKSEDPKELAKFEYLKTVSPAKKDIKAYKNDNRKVEIKTFANGTKGETWWKKGVMFSKPEYFVKGDVMIQDSKMDPALAAAVKEGELPDFPELGWLSLDTFIKKESEPDSKKKAYYFEISGEAQAEREYAAGLPRVANLKLQPILVWIDIDSKLPLRVETAEYTAVYKFKGFGAMPTPTGEIAEAIKKHFSEPF